MIAAIEAIGAPPILGIITQHVEEAASLRRQRTRLVRAPHIRLHLLRRHDERIAAHLDGIAVAGGAGREITYAAAPQPGGGEVFTAALVAIVENDEAMIGRQLLLGGESLDATRALVSAFGWASASDLHGMTKELLVSQAAHARAIGLAACAMHQVDPGVALIQAITDADVSLRACGLRVAGECGRRDLLGTCMTALSDEDATCRFWAARSAALLGDRGKSIDVLKHIALEAGPARPRALRLVFKLIETTPANVLLKMLAQDPSNIRHLIQGAGTTGDPHYLPWLIKQMEDLKLTRPAGEAFTFITGLDLAYLELDRKPPENFESGPNDDPNDDNVAMDDDDSLPWPDPVKIQAWWDLNQQHFQPGVRYFMGEPVNVQHCKQVLREGYQRQRIAAAEYLCLLQPGTKLFPTSAPAWRQLRWLNQME